MSQSAPANGNSHPATSDAAPANGKAANGFPAGRRGYPQPHHVEQLQTFWENQTKQVEEETDFKNHNLPLARIKKIMKADEDVRMISSEAPVVFAKACEMFIMELTMRSWMHTEENKRRTLQKSDIAAAVSRNDVYDFLVDIVPRDDGKEEVLGSVMPYYIQVPPPGTVFHGGAWPEPHVPPPLRSDDE